MTEEDKIVRIYVSGIYDLFHRGHLESLKICKNLHKNVYLIVGINGDEGATSYKRKPIYKEDDRYEIIKHIKFVDEIIENPPFIITEEFLDKYNIDYVVHGFSNSNDSNKQSIFFEIPQKLNKFREIPYYNEISTTDIINKIVKNANI
jgi:choline-phosphate cytidylyltransferase